VVQLSIKRKQGRGLTGVNFEVEVKLLLTEEERDLVNRFKLASEVVEISHKRSAWTGKFKDVKIKDIVNGNNFKAKDMGEVIDWTQSIMNAAEGLATYIEVARKFGGEEVLQIHAPDLDASTLLVAPNSMNV
jgi:hypothetical protein